MEHILYKTGDTDIPDHIKDMSTGIPTPSLACCRVCGEYEAGLDNPCKNKESKKDSIKNDPNYELYYTNL